MCLKCVRCEEIFNEYETVKHKGEQVCPNCYGTEYEEAYLCKCCGKYFLDEELESGFCQSCIEDFEFEYKHDPQRCFDLAKDFDETISLNSFIVSQFTKEQIEEILLKEVKEQAKIPFADYSNFIEQDKQWFLEMMQKGVDEVE